MGFKKCPYLRGKAIQSYNVKDSLFCEACQEYISFNKYHMVCFSDRDQNGLREYEKWCREYKEMQDRTTKNQKIG